jgi:cytochrome c556
MLLGLTLVGGVPAASFSPEERADLLKEIKEEQTQVAKYARINHGWDVFFKVVLLLLSVTAVVGAGCAATYGNEQVPRWLRVFNIASTGLVTLLSGFANTDFNLSQRRALCQKKADAFHESAQLLRYTDPDKEQFLKKLESIRALNDLTQPISQPNNAASPMKCAPPLQTD